MAVMTSTARPHLNRRLAEFGTTIFAEMSALAVRTGSINLGQGFPDTDGPESVREAAVRALRDGRGNQYPPGPGVPELRAAIAELAIERDLLVVTDEVYEHLVFDDAEHLPLASFPGLRERTVTIGSAGKTFSFTGWKVGWVTAAPGLVTAGGAGQQVP